VNRSERRSADALLRGKGCKHNRGRLDAIIAKHQAAIAGVKPGGLRGRTEPVGGTSTLEN
jgi:hypothetical protein